MRHDAIGGESDLDMKCLSFEAQPKERRKGEDGRFGSEARKVRGLELDYKVISAIPCWRSFLLTRYDSSIKAIKFCFEDIGRH